MAASAPAQALSGGNNADWVRRYPPLIAIVLAVVLAVFVLPSALNLPQSNPTETAEYAPVPPEHQSAPPIGGALSSLRLSGSAGLNAGGSTVSKRASARASAPTARARTSRHGSKARSKACHRRRYTSSRSSSGTSRNQR